MSRLSRMSDADLHQSMELAASAAKEARQSGDRKREDAFHKDLDGMIGEAKKRGWKKTSGWKPGRR